jgi:hypothetical protein
MKRHPLVRTIYLYLFTLVGLTLLTIGVVQLVGLGLKIYVFPMAEEELYKPVVPLLVPGESTGEATADDIQKMAEVCQSESSLSKEQQDLLGSWLEDYQEQKESRLGSEDIKMIKRQRTAAWALALILIGLPLYLYHWLTIKKEIKKEEE